MRKYLDVLTNESDLIKVCTDMEFKGVLIDKEYVKRSLDYEKRNIQVARQNFQLDTGVVYKDSGKVFAEIFTKRGETFPRTDKGNPSFTGDFLDYCTSPTAKLINKIRFHEKRAGTYFANFLYYCDTNNYIHPSMNQGGTKTGRFSYSSPNLQNLPKEDEEQLETNIRRSFIPPEGFIALSVDYDQQEFRLLLDYAGEEELIAKIKEGEDVHTATAKLLGITRKHAKTLNFALLYGVGLEKLAKMLDVSIQEAKAIKDLYFSKLKFVKRFLNEVRQKAERRGYTFNWLGRVYWCDNYRFSYKHGNYIIQGGGADIIKKAMVEISRHLSNKQSRMVIQVHDELWFYIHLSEMDLIPQIKDIMASIYKPFSGLNLTVSSKISKSSFSYWDLHEAS